MLFQTPEFLVLILSVLVGIALIRTHTLQLVFLLAASYIFYMWWNPAYIFLIVFSTLIDYFVGNALGRTDNRGARVRLLTLSCVANLGLLSTFKYFDFFTDSINQAILSSGGSTQLPTLHVLLPIGISFYTFQSMSYTIDVFRGKQKPERSLARFALYVAFFPQLVAGPILRSTQFLPQLYKVVNLRPENLRAGFHLVLSGLVKKLVIADNISPLADSILNSPQGLPSPVIWVGLITFAVQIYCDFAGYSDIARGLGRMFGYDIPINFNFPYLSKSITELWQRWHITLSTWLRDYLYGSLPGSRTNLLLAYRNLMITMVLCGLWHGAGWNFALFGAYLGTVLVIEWLTGWNRIGRGRRAGEALTPIDKWRKKILDIVRWGVTMYVILLGYIFFRVHSLPDIIYTAKKFIVFDFTFKFGTWGLAKANPFKAVMLLGAFVVLHAISYRMNGISGWMDRMNRLQQSAVYLMVTLALIWLWPSAEKSFVYFQF